MLTNATNDELLELAYTHHQDEPVTMELAKRLEQAMEREDAASSDD